MCPQSVSRTKADRGERVRSILDSKHLTLSQVSQKSAALYGPSSPYFVPHNLYYDLRLETFSPSIYQMFAISRVSGYRLNDWLGVFGYDLEDISRLQVLLPSNRTILLESSFDNSNSWVPWFRNRNGNAAAPPIAPLAQLLEFTTHPRRLHSLSEFGNRGFLYAKIGRQDALAFPDLLPGSIVRVDPTYSEDGLFTALGKASDQIFLVEHGNGLHCSRLRALGNNRICPADPRQRIELRLPHEAKILGVVDLEIRPLARAGQSATPSEAAMHWKPGSFASETRLSHLVRRARRKMALSFREASALSRRIAELLGDDQYFVSSSSLSDYEACDVSPRHFQKVITLCLLYGLDLFTFLRTAGILLEEEGQEAIPDQFTRRSARVGIAAAEAEFHETDHRGFLGELLGQLREVPLFLRRSLGPLSGLPAPSLNDFFWVGGERNAIHPYLTNAVLVVANRRIKKPRCDSSKPPWQQSLYVIVERDGNYLFGCCGLEKGTLVIYPYPANCQSPRRLRYPHDAEVVGQIVTVVRKLS